MKFNIISDINIFLTKLKNPFRKIRKKKKKKILTIPQNIEIGILNSVLSPKT